MNNPIKVNKGKAIDKTKDAEGPSCSSSSDTSGKPVESMCAILPSNTETRRFRFSQFCYCFKRAKSQNSLGKSDAARLIKGPDASSDSSTITKNKSSQSTATSIDKTPTNLQSPILEGDRNIVNVSEQLQNLGSKQGKVHSQVKKDPHRTRESHLISKPPEKQTVANDESEGRNHSNSLLTADKHLGEKGSLSIAECKIDEIKVEVSDLDNQFQNLSNDFVDHQRFSNASNDELNHDKTNHHTTCNSTEQVIDDEPAEITPKNGFASEDGVDIPKLTESNLDTKAIESGQNSTLKPNERRLPSLPETNTSSRRRRPLIKAFSVDHNVFISRLTDFTRCNNNGL